MIEQLLERLEKSKTKLNYKVGDKVLFQGEVFEVSYITAIYNYGFLDGYFVYLKGFGWVIATEIEPINKGEQMTNKQEAKQQLEKLEAEVQKLKEIINKPEKAGSLLPEEGTHCIFPSSGRLSTSGVETMFKYGVNRFPSEDIAQSYAEAFNTMLALRKCEGSCTTVNGKEQWSIDIDQSLKDMEIYAYLGNYSKIINLSPSFSSKEYAQAAIDKVGKENIIKMFKTLHGIYN